MHNEPATPFIPTASGTVGPFFPPRFLGEGDNDLTLIESGAPAANGASVPRAQGTRIHVHKPLICKPAAHGALYPVARHQGRAPIRMPRRIPPRLSHHTTFQLSIFTRMR